MEFSLSLGWCDNSSYIRCELDLYIHPTNYRGRGFFYLLTWMVWYRLCSWWRCRIASIVLGSVISYRWLLVLGHVSKTFQWHHPLYSLRVVQSIIHHCISRRWNSHMYVMLVLRGEGFRWLVYIKNFQNARTWKR